MGSDEGCSGARRSQRRVNDYEKRNLVKEDRKLCLVRETGRERRWPPEASVPVSNRSSSKGALLVRFDISGGEVV